MSSSAFDKKEVEQFTRGFESLFYAGYAATMASSYAEDAKLLSEDTDPIWGRSAKLLLNEWRPNRWSSGIVMPIFSAAGRR